MFYYPEVETFRRYRVAFLLLGIVLIVLGAIALSYALLTTVLSVIFFGWLLLLGGIVQTICSFTAKERPHFFFHLLGGVLQIIVGIMLTAYPGAGALALTMLLAAFFLAIGTYRIIGSGYIRTPNWGWTLASGIISLLLGILVLAQWPVSGLFLIGMLVGVEMIVYGWSWLMLSFALGHLGRHIEHEGPRPAMP
jgi:uncharacterized membrane protein HdeD (DUF308 family)